MKMFKKKLASVILAAALLAALSGQALAAFSDVPDTYLYKAEIDYCQAKGYVTGTGNGTFGPNGPLTRAQLAVVWCRLLMLRETNSGFTDITPLRNYYDTAAIVMSSLGVFGGTSDTTFSPDAGVTREQLALITARTFNLGVMNDDDYKIYADYAAISVWAQDAVSACINARVFQGLYDGTNLQPQSAVTRGEICKLLYTVSQPAYTVTVAPLTGGTVTAFPTTARAGTIVNLIVSPDTGKRLKAGTLVYNGSPVSGNSFIMPAADVLVNAEFETLPAQLMSIEITNLPSVTTYFAGEALDLTGMTVTALYSDGTSAVVSGYTAEPPAGTVLSAEGSFSVSISYSEGSITKTASFNVQVSVNPG